MGINKLIPFLKEKCPEAFQDLPYSHFTGKRVAVDSDNVLRKLMARAHKEIVNQTDVCVREPDRGEIVQRWLFHVKNEVNKFLKFGITLIFVFDGAYIDEKSDTQLKRRESKKKLINDAEAMKQKVLQIDELERTPQMITELRKKMHHLGNITPEEKKLVCDILSNLGFPILFATEEGEKLAAMLCIEGLVYSVYSKDSDVLAMGCPVSFGDEAGWVYNKSSGRTEMAVKSVIFKPILSALEMEYTTFLDLCIMSGCDFNSNIPQLAVKKAYKLLLEYKNIDNLPSAFDEKKKILNHIRCREIFARQISKDICKTDVCLDIDFSLINNRGKVLSEFAMYTSSVEIKELLEEWINEVMEFYKNFPKPSNVFIQKIPSVASSRIKLKVISNNANNVNTNSNDNKSEVVSEKLCEPLSEKSTESVTHKVPPQKASPKRMTTKVNKELNSQQLQKLKLRLAKQ